ncbi:MAG: potassium-transporting ATPase subunit F [Desulfomonilaceae bacterium]
MFNYILMLTGLILVVYLLAVIIRPDKF